MVKTHKNSYLRVILMYKRLRNLGVNGLTIEQFAQTLLGMLEPKSFYFSLEPPKKEIIIAETIHIADVRQNPHVKPGFRPKNLKNLAEAHGWEYHHYKLLGNPYHRKHLAEQDPPKAREEYLEYLKNDFKVVEEFHELFGNLAFRKITCIICYCNLQQEKNIEIAQKTGVWPCHGIWLKEYLMRFGRKKLGFEPIYSETIKIKN